MRVNNKKIPFVINNTRIKNMMIFIVTLRKKVSNKKNQPNPRAYSDCALCAPKSVELALCTRRSMAFTQKVLNFFSILNGKGNSI